MGKEVWNAFDLFEITFEAPKEFIDLFYNEIQESIVDLIQGLTYRCVEHKCLEDDNND